MQALVLMSYAEILFLFFLTEAVEYTILDFNFQDREKSLKSLHALERTGISLDKNKQKIPP